MTKFDDSCTEMVKKTWTLDTKILVRSDNRQIAFASPSFGPNNYLSVGQEILSHNLKVPTGDYTAYLLHAAYCNSNVFKQPEFEDVRNIVRNSWLMVFNKNLWTDKGVYVIADFNAKGRSEALNSSQLEESLKGGKEIKGVRFSKDGKIRFAPAGSYRLGTNTSKSLSEDGFIIASYNFDGAEKLAEVSDKLKYNPVIYGVKVAEGNKPELRVSAIDCLGGSLCIDGHWHDYGSCCAFAICI